jgi:O-antigen/teichoic acid export membrane protein
VLRVMLSLVVAVVAILAAPLSGGSGHTQAVIAVAAIGMILTTAGGVFTDGYQAFETMRPASLANFAGALLLTLVSVAVIRYGGGIREMALAYVLGPLCSLFLLWLWSRGRPFQPRPSLDLPEFGQMLRRASPFFAIILVDMLGTRMDVVILARVLGDAKLGGYTAAMSLVDRLMIFADGAATALLPTVAHLWVHAPVQAAQLMRKAALWMLIVSLPLAVGVSLLARTIVTVIFGPQYALAGTILAVLIWRLPTICLATLQSHSLIAVERQNLVLRTSAFAVAFYIALLVPLVHYYGLLGGAIAVVTRGVITVVLRLPFVARYFPRLWSWGQLARVGAALALMAVPLVFASACGLGLQFVALVAVSGVIYVACLGIMRVVPVLFLLGQLCRRLGVPAAAIAWAGEGSGASD